MFWTCSAAFLGDGKDRGCVWDITGYPACSGCIVSLAGFVVLLFKFIVPVLLVFGLRLVSVFWLGNVPVFISHIFLWGSCFWFCIPSSAACLPPPPPHQPQLFHIQLCYTQFFEHNFVFLQLCHTHTIFHTQPFHAQLFHVQLVTYNFVTHNLSHTQLCHRHTHTIFHAHTHNLSPAALSHTTLSHTLTFVLPGRRGWRLRHWAGRRGTR